MSKNTSNKLGFKKDAEPLIREMEIIAEQLRALIVGMPPLELLGYIYAQHLMHAILVDTKPTDDSVKLDKFDLISDIQFVLEYVHAVLAVDPEPLETIFNEQKCGEIFKLGSDLRQKSLLYALITSASTKDGAFGPNTGEIEFHAKSSWVLLRGNRYQVLEGEFYRYVLAPHDNALKKTYGMGAQDIAVGFQAMADATRSGHSTAIEELMKHFDAVKARSERNNEDLKNTVESWSTENPNHVQSVGLAIDDVFRGGVANVSRHTNLPAILLTDLAFQRGEETDFFAPGDYSGTPFRTLPARKKPLIKIGSDYYAVDPCFTRDAGYRALLYNLLLRNPEYKTDFNARQKEMSEAAFADILKDQLPGAQILQEVYYKDTVSRQWAENDTLIIIEDVLFLVEAKSGAAATIASPALDFNRHAQSVQDLVIKAYKQCERFFAYISSADEVPLYRFADRKYVEWTRIRRSDYRLMFPIGLTVESFSPFSTFCKDLPEIRPLLGKHPFISLSIDDLLVLRRLLPTPGEFVYYMEVRQSMAGLRGAHLFDEFDHLGAYFAKNRFYDDMIDQMKENKANLIVWDGMSSDIDRSFEAGDWERGPFPTQKFPSEILSLLKALDESRTHGWLLAENCVRSLGEEGRNDLARVLTDLRKSLKQHSSRNFLFGSTISCFFWLQKSDEKTDWQKVNAKASATALLTPSDSIIGILIDIADNGSYKSAQIFEVAKPTSKNDSNVHIFDEAERLKSSVNTSSRFPAEQAQRSPPIGRKPGRNDPCPCGSGLKYKKCHGRILPNI